MEDTAAHFALLSEERKTEVLAALVKRGQQMEQEADRLEQEFLSLDNELDDLESIPEERMAHLRETTHGIKQETDALRSEVTALGFGGIFANPSEPLYRSVWRNLPPELQQNVFAQLPLRHIVRLQTVDLAWHHYVSGVPGAIPDFMRKWDEINPKTFGMRCDRDDFDDAGIVAVRVYDSDSNKWRKFTHTSIFGFIDTMHAGDGGLVCIVPLGVDKQKRPMSIVVLNPLTKRWKELPELPHALLSVQLRMVQLVMDRRAKSYKVIAVGPKEVRSGGDGVSIYSSVTGEWSSPEASRDIIFGYCQRFVDDSFVEDDGDDVELYSVIELWPCAYDCVNGTMFELDNDQSPWKTYSWRSYSLVHERLYLLHQEVYRYDHAGVVEERPRLCVSEFQAEADWHPLPWNQAALTCQVNWVKLKDYACDGFEDRVDDFHIHVCACNGVLLVTSEDCNQSWLCRDLLSSKWETVSGISRSIFDEDDMTMFELRFDAIP